MSLEARKTKEGSDHMTAAAKHLETSAWKLKFSPDWDSAADEFQKAAVCFKVGRVWDQAKSAHMKAAEAYANSGSLFHAGKQFDQALLICKEMGQLEEVEDLASRGGLLYRQAGSPESASHMLIRAAKLLEVKYPERAISLYEKAADTVGTEDRPAEAGQHMEQAARLTVRARQYDRAADLLNNTLNMYSEAGTQGTAHGRVVLAFVIVQEQRGDSVAASKVWSQWGGLCDGYQSAAANDIISGFSDQDGELARRGLDSPAVKALDNDYVKLARDMEVPRGGGVGEEEELDLC
eukprot:GFUD01041527.1.p1 GENE.GFUD01041527.1~~GFUD01041527.1.p1  ORF type:complete len:293 (+),score=90.46 GFUD01041527.1:46-924(+)